MIYSVEFHPEARMEVDEARDWYAVEAPHVVESFVDDFIRAIDWVSAMPQACPPGVRGTRCAKLRSFPYVIHFRLHGEQLEILAVAHSRRHPNYWHSRLS